MGDLIEKPPPDAWAEQQGETDALLGIYLREADLREINRFCARHLRARVGGALVGEAFRWRERTYVEIQSHVPVESPYDDRSWRSVERSLSERAREGPAESLVGWFVSEPGLGVALRSDALKLHVKRFQKPWQIVLVLDPKAQQMGFFHRMKPAPCGFQFIRGR